MKPMLSATVEDVTELRYPLLASPKLDGIRALVLNGVLVSRNLKPIVNDHVQGLFGWNELEGLDGELIMGDPCDPAAFRNTTSAVMSKDGKPAVTFYVFDDYSVDGTFEERLASATTKVDQYGNDSVIKVIEHLDIEDADELGIIEGSWLESGYEGVMLRDPAGKYKQGRSTLREHGLMKLKRFCDAEAEIIGFEEQMHNSNEAKRDKLGRVERSNHKAGMVGKDTLGALRVRGINGDYAGVEFSVGSGFDDSLRRKIWTTQQRNLGKTIKFKYFPVGSKDAPRFPVFLGFRED